MKDKYTDPTALKLLREAKWGPVKGKMEFGANMMIADVALGKDQTMNVIATREAVEALSLTAGPAGKTKETNMATAAKKAPAKKKAPKPMVKRRTK